MAQILISRTKIGLTLVLGMIEKTLDEKALKMLAEAGTLHELRAVRQGDDWSLQAQVGADLLSVCSAREDVRLWRSLTAVERFCTKIGVKLLAVEL